MRLGRLENLNPRDVWRHEAAEFTPWLLENAAHLAEALGIDLELGAAEHAVGTFSLDLIGHDLTHDAVLIVENQLETTDHTHLGQILTYAAGTAASTIVWIATSFREEHRQALDWLNESTGDDARFFGVEIQVVRIEDSPPAPLFRLVAQPNDWQKRVKTVTQANKTGTKGTAYAEFWAKFLARVRQEHPLWTRARSVQPQSWFSMTCPGLRGGQLNPVFTTGGRIRHELYIDTGDRDRNKQIFHALAERKNELESSYGGPLVYEELPDRRASRICEYGEGDVLDTDRHDEMIGWFIERSQRLRTALAAAAPVAELDDQGEG